MPDVGVASLHDYFSQLWGAVELDISTTNTWGGGEEIGQGTTVGDGGRTLIEIIGSD